MKSLAKLNKQVGDLELKAFLTKGAKGDTGPQGAKGPMGEDGAGAEELSDIKIELLKLENTSNQNTNSINFLLKELDNNHGVSIASLKKMKEDFHKHND